MIIYLDDMERLNLYFWNPVQGGRIRF